MPALPAAPPVAACPYCGADHGETALRCPATDMVLPFAGRLLVGKFRFVAELGRGGMGAVWLARNVHVDREVALKLILPEVLKNPEVVARFQDEARVAARVGHAGICDILDFEQTPIGPVIVMELLRGENLGQRIDREGALAVPVAVGVVRQALLALEAAHRAGVIHRDLKPENLFLHQPDSGAMVVKLMDFGISKFIDRAGGLTGSGVTMGTPEYMAPEQVGGADRADARTDVWAMGAVLYRALTGVNAFTGDNVVTILLAVTATEPAPPDSHVPSLPPALSAIVLRCLAKRPGDRFQSATELADALRPFAGPTPAEREAIGSLPTLALDVAAPPPVIPQVLLPPPRTVHAVPPRTAWFVALALLVAAGLAAWLATRTPADDAALATRKDDTIPADDAALAARDDIAVPVSAEPAADRPAPSLPLPAGPAPSPPLPPGPIVPPPANVDTTPTPPNVATTPTPPNVDMTPKPPDAAAPIEPPPALIVGGDHVTPSVAGKPGNQHWAKEYCAALGRNKYLDIDRWKLANPREARLFTGVAGVRPGAYWTTALHRGVALIVSLPGGKDSSVRASKTYPRPLCVATRQ